MKIIRLEELKKLQQKNSVLERDVRQLEKEVRELTAENRKLKLTTQRQEAEIEELGLEQGKPED